MHNKDFPLVLTLDAGGTNFVFSAVKDFKQVGTVINKKAFPHNLDNCLASIISGFKETITSINQTPQAISFAFPGPADYQKGIIGDLFNLPCFRGGIPLKDIIETEFNIPVFINNDGDLFALGESEKGLLPFINAELKDAKSQKSYKNIFGVSLGTGFGGGGVMDSKLLLGDNSSSSEVWLFANKVYQDYNAESSIGINAIKREYAVGCDIKFEDTPEPEVIYKIAKGEVEGNKDAANTAFQKMGRALGHVLANVTTIIDGLIVIGGGLSGAYDVFIDAILEEMNGTYKQFKGSNIPRLTSKVYDFENKTDIAKFLHDDITELNYANKSLLYDRHKRIGIGKSRLGTSNAVAIGAYKYAIGELVNK